MANGQVTTGFSKPYVATYSADGSTITYGTPQILARGVDVDLDVEASEDNYFYADNVQAESDSGTMSGGSITLTVDGLLTAAERLIMGLPTGTGGVTYDDDQAIPDVGLGFIRRVMSGGVTSYIPYMFHRVSFSPIAISAATQEEEIDWQTQELTATLKRSEAAKRPWQWHGDPETSEAAAVTALLAAFA